jgi:hypothetical protein
LEHWLKLPGKKDMLNWIFSQKFKVPMSYSFYPILLPLLPLYHPRQSLPSVWRLTFLFISLYLSCIYTYS